LIEQGDDMNRDQIVNWLVTNCSCWKGKKEVLGNEDSFSDDDLKKLREVAERSASLEVTANALAEVATVFGAPHDLEINAMPAFIKKKIAARKDEEDMEDEEEDEDMEENTTKAEKAPVKVANRVAALPRTSSKPRWKTANDWMNDPASAPADIKAAVRNAMEIEQRERMFLVDQLVANVEDESSRKRLTSKLGAKPIDELRDLVALVPATQESLRANQRNDFPFALNYLGAAGGPANYNQLTDNDQSNVLDLDSARREYDPAVMKKATARA
jgi:hypothetical protein